jgi:threonyl-tRNA synthetase
MINITFPDGHTKEYANGSTPMDIAKSISHGLAKRILISSFNGEPHELNRPIDQNGDIMFFSWEENEGKSTFWHSSAHLMAEAVEALFPGAKFGIGPPIDNGFYYDIDFGDKKLNEEDLKKIENKMKSLIKSNAEFIREEVSKKEALEYFKQKDDEYKLELIDGLEDGEITFYKQGGFVDLCRGPHIPSTKYIKAVKLLSIAGAYWRGDESKKQLTRIYGITFPKQEELDHHLQMLEEAKKRDHRKLGKELGLFMFSQNVGSGLPIWLPNGTIVRNKLENFLQEEQLRRGYHSVITPHIGKIDLYKTSGHYDKYGEDSFQSIKTPNPGEEYFLKPMNCPHHCEIFKHVPKSYRDLPYRVAEFGTVYRYEQSGELNGLTRVRGFTQDDAHIFCSEDQVKDEFKSVIDLVQLVFNKLGFKEVMVQVSLRDPETPEKYIGNPKLWDKAEASIMEAAKEKGLETIIEYGEAAFYGPKLDFMVKDALGRSWQLGTIQLDYNLPERFELEYIDADNEAKRPVMIHRAPFGSMERFIAILLEHCAGKLPLWLSPEQVRLLPISDKFMDYAENIFNSLNNCDIRCSIDRRTEKIGRKIRDAEINKVPIMIILGEKESSQQTLAVRLQGQGDQGSYDLNNFIEFFNKKLNQISN